MDLCNILFSAIYSISLVICLVVVIICVIVDNKIKKIILKNHLDDVKRLNKYSDNNKDKNKIFF